MRLTREHVLAVYADPAPKGSMKCVGGRGRNRHQLVENSVRTAPWREQVVRAVRGAWPTLSGLSGPLGVEVTLTIRRPPSHYGTGRNTHLLKPTAPPYPDRVSRGLGGDVDKLARVVLDALEDAGTYGNDAQVVELIARKTYADGPGVLPDALTRPGARLRLYPIEDGSLEL